MPDSDAKAVLLRSLHRLVRGLSALFWGLPMALVIGFQTARSDWLRPLGVMPPLAVAGLLWFGLFEISHFRRQERPWRYAVEWGKVLALINVGLAPYLFWWRSLPQHPFFLGMMLILILNSLLFLYALNAVLPRLTAMLPDQTLRYETRFFSSLNRHLVLIALLILVLYWALLARDQPLENLRYFLILGEHLRLGFLVFMILLPISLTMTLLWKVKEVILGGVFHVQAPS
jgi:hypothetical protein